MMKINKVSLLIVALVFISFASANIVLEKGPANLYNLKDKIEITAKIIPSGEINGLVVFYLLCENSEIEIYKEYISTNEEIEKDILIPLVKEFIFDSKGKCAIEASINGEKKVISSFFKISDVININFDENTIFEPGKKVVLNGTAFKENGKPAEGIIEITIKGSNDIYSTSSIIDGKFNAVLLLPDNFKAGEHKIILNAYEKNSANEIINSGVLSSEIFVPQVPTNLEVLLDSTNVNPGDSITGKVILHDQTGDIIHSAVYLAVKNYNNEIVDKIVVYSGDDFEYKIDSSEPSNMWAISAYSEELLSKVNFKILEKKEISMDIVNQTLVVENTGNVIYNETIQISIGEQDVPLLINLAPGQSEKYTLSAPTGTYVVSSSGFEKTVLLTGNAIAVEKLSNSKSGLMRILLWVFVVLVLAFVSRSLFLQVRKRTFFGRRSYKQAKQPLELKEIPTPFSIGETKTKAELSLSITGTKQNSPVGCIVIKNYEEFRGGAGGVSETLSRISSLVENKKGLIYQNKGNIFFMIPPIKTKTFNNELPILDLMKDVKVVLDEHNRKFKQRILYGLSLNYGTIVTKEEGGVIKFMSMGTLMATSKRLASKSSGEILITDKFKERLTTEVKVEPVKFDDMNAFVFKEINLKKDNSLFIQGFLERQKK